MTDYEPRTTPLGAPAAPVPPPGAPQYPPPWMPTPPPPPRRTRVGLVVAVILAAVVVFAGVGLVIGLAHGGGKKAVAAGPSPSWSPMSWAPETTPAAPADQDGLTACREIKALVSDDGATLADQDLQPIVDAGSRSTNADVQIRAKLLGDRWALAKAGGPSDFVDNVNLLTAGIQMETACVQAGLND